MKPHPGLFWFPSFLTPEEIPLVEQWLQTVAWFPVPTSFGKVGQNPRYAAHYGYYYPYSKQGINHPQIPAGVAGGYYNPAPELLPWMKQIRDHIYWLLQQQPSRGVNLHLSEKDTFDQVIIN